MKKELSQSGKYHQDALRIAIKMQTLYGQSISVGNLGLVAFKKKDYSTATTCFQQHIQLVQALMDVDAEVKAWISVSYSISHKLLELEFSTLFYKSLSWRQLTKQSRIMLRRC